MLTKVDLTDINKQEAELQQCQAIGYNLHKVSATENISISELKATLNHQISIFTGQSGVGK